MSEQLVKLLAMPIDGYVRLTLRRARLGNTGCLPLLYVSKPPALVIRWEGTSQPLEQTTRRPRLGGEQRQQCDETEQRQLYRQQPQRQNERGHRHRKPEEGQLRIA
jgi:hypothetical protein